VTVFFIFINLFQFVRLEFKTRSESTGRQSHFARMHHRRAIVQGQTRAPSLTLSASATVRTPIIIDAIPNYEQSTLSSISKAGCGRIKGILPLAKTKMYFEQRGFTSLLYYNIKSLAVMVWRPTNSICVLAAAAPLVSIPIMVSPATCV
jgi:hypothetical protein